jgi:hypothetical protein
MLSNTSTLHIIYLSYFSNVCIPRMFIFYEFRLSGIDNARVIYKKVRHLHSPARLHAMALKQLNTRMNVMSFSSVLSQKGIVREFLDSIK